MSLKLYVCCMCFPLRIGLLVWGYCGLVLNYISLIHTVCKIYDFLDGSDKTDPSNFISLALTMGGLILHFIFYIVLLAGLHKRSCTLLEIFYGFCVIVLIMWAAVQALYIPLKAYKLYPRHKFDIWWTVLMNVVVAAIGVLLQFYLVVSVRSMISTIEDDKECSAPLEEMEDHNCVLHMYSPKECCNEC